MNIERCLISVALVSFVWANDSRAEIVQFQMTGTVMVSDPSFALPANVVTGAPFTATITYDTSVADMLPGNPGLGRYEFHRPQDAFSLSLSVGDLFLHDDPADEIVRVEVQNDYTQGIVAPTDSFNVSGIRLAGGPNLPDPYFLQRIQLVYDNLDQNSWTSDALPTSLNLPTSGRFEVQAYRGDEQPPLGRPYDITAIVTSVSTVPEPATSSLAWMLGMVGISFIRGRKTVVMG